ncbi:MAG: NAD-dependent dihydropyrimidine dehydrogenase subunit PreA [Anaerolineaceae bacterium]
MSSLKTFFCDIDFANPFILAASPSTDDREMVARGFEAGWAGAVLKTTSHESEEVSIAYPIMAALGPGPRMLGLQNIDLLSEKHIHEIAEDIAWLKARFPERRVISSLMARTHAEWKSLVEISEQAGADLIEASISCPQGAELDEDSHASENITPQSGWMVSQNPAQTERVTRWVVQASKGVPVYVKLSPTVTDIAGIGRAVQAGGAQAACAIDTLEGILGINRDNLSPLPSVQGRGTRGGYSGRAVKPVALRCVADLAGALTIPISGVGGIYDWRDALDFILLGASTVQVCTAVMQHGFGIIAGLTDGLARWLDDKGLSNPQEAVGLALDNLTEHDHLPHGVKVISKIDQELCIRCGLCYITCRDGGHVAMNFSTDRRVEVLEERCVGCGMCAQVCPVPGCISIS